MSRHRVLIAAVVLVVVGASAAAAVLASRPAKSVPAIAADCGNSVSGHGFRVFSCMSGGAAIGHPHPKELLVIRADGSSVGYPVYRTASIAAGDGEVVATHNDSLVRVTTSRLVPLLTNNRLAGLLHVRPNALWDVVRLAVDTRGDITFSPSFLAGHRSGCRTPLLELTPAGAVRRLRPSTSTVCV
ncbi:MAG TPA: hypothetical protein VFB25_06760 [Gaiellaceae bacterium]|nr:hypothetical protein [Gaiellaceae bacterium]